MAFILFLAGSLAGVIAMLTSMIVFDTSFLAALSVWFVTGMVISLAGLVLAMVPRGEMVRGEMVEA